jgi:hypothetical protein
MRCSMSRPGHCVDGENCSAAGPPTDGRALAAMGNPCFLPCGPHAVLRRVKNELPAVTVREGRRRLTILPRAYAERARETGPEKPAQGELAFSLSTLVPL